MSTLHRIVDLPYCVSCCGVLLFPRWETFLKQTVEASVVALCRQIQELKLVELGDDELHRKIEAKLATDFTCVCCLNSIRQAEVFALADKIIADIEALDAANKMVQLDLTMSPCMDACRVASRFIIDEIERSNPRLDTVLDRMLCWYLNRHRGIQVKTSALMKVTVKWEVGDQMYLCCTLYPDFRPKKQKKRFFPTLDEAPLVVPTTEEEKEASDVISQSNVDKVLVAIRSMSHSALQQLQQRYLELLPRFPSLKVHHSTDYGTVFVYGRYHKYARDVPQSAWTIAAYNEVDSHQSGSGVVNGDSVDPASATTSASNNINVAVRIGRASISEIVAEATVRLTKAKETMLHGCGREDIDVRCLGNGRPFVLQIVAPKVPIEDNILQQITADINGRNSKGLNSQGDIKIGKLHVASARLWETMQKEAEEKKKAYRAVCYSAVPLTPADLEVFNDRVHLWNRLQQWREEVAADSAVSASASSSASKNLATAEISPESSNNAVFSNTAMDVDTNADIHADAGYNKVAVDVIKSVAVVKKTNKKQQAALVLEHGGGVDEEATRFLFSLQQKTPLRVIHRRSLMTRTRRIYALEAQLLNAHYFLLSLVTGAGTYVKEFVHGDLGRTQPNVATLLGKPQNETEILQLDVIWLYDKFDALFPSLNDQPKAVALSTGAQSSVVDVQKIAEEVTINASEESGVSTQQCPQVLDECEGWLLLPPFPCDTYLEETTHIVSR